MRVSDTDASTLLHLLRAIDEVRRDNPQARCDTEALAERLTWSRTDIQRALWDARMAGFIVARAAGHAYVDLTDIQLKPLARRLLHRLRLDYHPLG